MKIRELEFFDKALRKEACNYLKKYFKEDCEVKWSFDDRILIDIDFKVVDGKEHAHLIITDGENCKIYLHKLGNNINILDFKKYIDKFLNMEYKKAEYINTKDFKKICALYDSLDLKYKKDDIKEFYNAIASVLSEDYEPYILDYKEILTNSNKTHARQDIYSSKEHLTFTVAVAVGNNYYDNKINFNANFNVDYEQINILTLAEGLVNIQKKLEEIIK